jgi:hypothetical protein
MEEYPEVKDCQGTGNGADKNPANDSRECSRRGNILGNNSRLAWILGQLLLMVVISCGSIFAYDRLFAIKVATVDLRGMVETQQSLYAAGKLSEEGMVEQYRHLDKRLRELSKNHVVVLADTVFKTSSRNVIPVPTGYQADKAE